MDLHNKADMVAEEDRISNLPDDVIHHIFSFFDMKHAIQTSTLSRRWKSTWTSMPHLNINSHLFGSLRVFAKYVKDALSHRNNRAEVSALDLSFTGAGTQFVVRSILNYAYTHNVREMTIEWDGEKVRKLPQSLFSSRILKNLTLANKQYSSFSSYSCVPNEAWDFPSLETLTLRNIRLGDNYVMILNLFSKCLKLNDVSILSCSMYLLETFNLCAPQLLNLTITDVYAFPKVLNVVAPQLKNLTASVGIDLKGAGYSTPIWLGSLHLSIEDFVLLDKVNLFFPASSYKREINGHQLFDLFHKVRSAKFLILDVDIIEMLSSCMDQLLHIPPPFNNLECLKIDATRVNQNDYIAQMASIVGKYLLENSPNATLIIDLPPQVPQKRSRPEVPNDALTSNKVAKLNAEEKQPQEDERMLKAELRMQAEVDTGQKKILQIQGQLISYQNAKIQMHNEVLAQKKAKLEDLLLQLFQVQDEVIKCKIEELKVQVESGNPDYEFIRSMGCTIKSVMDLISESSRVDFEARFSSQYEEFKSLVLTQLDDGQWAKIESALGSIRNSQMAHANNHQSELDVHAADLPTVPNPSSTEMAASSSGAGLESNKSVQPLDSSTD